MSQSSQTLKRTPIVAQGRILTSSLQYAPNLRANDPGVEMVPGLFKGGTLVIVGGTGQGQAREIWSCYLREGYMQVYFDPGTGWKVEVDGTSEYRIYMDDKLYQARIDAAREDGLLPAIVIDDVTTGASREE